MNRRADVVTKLVIVAICVTAMVMCYFRGPDYHVAGALMAISAVAMLASLLQ